MLKGDLTRGLTLCDCDFNQMFGANVHRGLPRNIREISCGFGEPKATPCWITKPGELHFLLSCAVACIKQYAVGDIGKLGFAGFPQPPNNKCLHHSEAVFGAVPVDDRMGFIVYSGWVCFLRGLVLLNTFD